MSMVLEYVIGIQENLNLAPYATINHYWLPLGYNQDDTAMQ